MSDEYYYDPEMDEYYYEFDRTPTTEQLMNDKFDRLIKYATKAKEAYKNKERANTLLGLVNCSCACDDLCGLVDKELK